MFAENHRLPIGCGLPLIGCRRRIQASGHSVTAREEQINVTDPFTADVDAVQSIGAVPTILEVVCRTTGMGFAAVARVSEDRWIALLP